MPEQLDAGPDRLLFRSILPDLDAEATFDGWTVPEQLQTWWPPVAEIEPHLGGSYHLFWPSQNWHLRGRFIAYEPAKRLAYTWRWDHVITCPVSVIEIRNQSPDVRAICNRPYKSSQSFGCKP